MRARLISFAAGLMIALVGCAVARAEVIISEIMYNPQGMDIEPGVFNQEWVEIFNTGSSTVDLGGWIFEDIEDSAAASPIPSGTMLDPGEALVLTGDGVTFNSQWKHRTNHVVLGNFPVLANGPSSTNEILALKNSFGVIQDTVNYDDSGDWPTDISNGPSIYLLPDYLSSSGNNNGTHWASSTAAIDDAYRAQGVPQNMASPGTVSTEPTVFPAFTPSPDAAWSMVVFPDTQNYVKTQAHLPNFVDMAEWVRDNRTDFNIQLVLQEGDLVNRNSDESPSSGENPATLQWQNAKATMDILNGEVPYILNVGNHDAGIIEDPQNPSTRLNEFFSSSDNPLNDPLQGGILKGVMQPGHLENAYYELTAPDGREMLIFSLAWDPQPAQLSWANQIAGQSKYNDHTAVLVIHDFLSSSGNRSSNGQTVWDDLVSGNENFEMVFNGHFGGNTAEYLLSTADDGNQVHQMFFNTQSEGNGGNGWLRVVEFLEDGKTVRVRTYSPTFGYIRDDIENAFTIELSELFNPLLGDFNDDGIVDAADYTVWRDNLGASTALTNDNGLGTPIGQAHYDLWKSNFGSTSEDGAGAGSVVPEPETVVLLLIAGLLALTFTRRNPITGKQKE